ncbi:MULTISPECIES: 3,4-dihydroxy-2-butanone-4-phosphate synthase [Acidianus]|uniref:3,4-dihydroxy-2-butanone 4-phosphate synthase n=1 Tax=Candidatus Acidianus copahuensis TaxID=1160895 RepID=A0A031LNI1_9CREN|nr:MULTISPECIES: 3,4-dihydroxy-2-butanone-4-phosphate synthase [Acidianus]EZQ03104.1 3,4-dihydroxy-2-butanone 4-phosphate synthase [Candidatus Acidianus copahuensis]NON62470.1 3,4-dihydroxy-2-butanone 4-phosphate synthase [Acidianus sp. RZ1]
MNLKEEIRKTWESGLPVLVYDFDGREEETDMIFYAGVIDWKKILTLRNKAGGLICYATGHNETEKLGLSFLTKILEKAGYSKLIKRPKYGDEPAFMIYVNHISTTTGISDYDRATTISKLHSIIEEIDLEDKDAINRFYNEFYAPGHVPVLASRGLKNRRGHTELSVALAEYVGLKKSVVFAEMLDEGKSLNKEKAYRFSRNEGIPLVTGKDILEVVYP